MAKHANIKPPKNGGVNHVGEFISESAHGVTTRRDPSIDSDLPGWGDVYSYYDNIASGYMLGPRSFGAFAIVGTDVGRQINTQADASMFARRAKAAGAGFLKGHDQVTRRKRQWPAVAPRKEGRKIHALDGRGARRERVGK